MAQSWSRQYEEGLPEDRLPINVLPYANEEFIPPPPTQQQLEIHRQALADCDEQARRHGMSRRRFLQTSAAAAVTAAAINRVMGLSGGHYAFADHAPTEACELHYPAFERENLPGEFIMDIQTHHVDSGGEWRLLNPGQHAFFAAIWAQSSCGELDRIECLGRYHYIKELFLDSATNVTVLSAVPYRPDGQPLPIEEAAETCGMVNGLAGGTRRAIMHRFVMPNRGSAGNYSDSLLGPHGIYPLFMEEEFELMEYSAAAFPEHLRAWKIYTPWGDIPNASGWWLDDPVGHRFIQKVAELGDRYSIPKLICAHKGFALPSFDQAKAATRDVGVVAPIYEDVSFCVYHSGYDNSIGGPVNRGTSVDGPYPLDIAPDGTYQLGAGDESDETVRSIDRGVDNFIKALRENGWSARHFAPGGSPRTPLEDGDGDPTAHANVPNVYAELGSVWGTVADDPEEASFLLSKLIYYVGPKRVVWGTDSLWGGSPQGQINLFRTFQLGQAMRDLYNLPHGLDGDVGDPSVNALEAGHPERTIRNGILGRNVAPVYEIDPDAMLRDISCDDLQAVRDEYLLNPMAENQVYGPRTAAGVFEELKREPWYNGARLRQNEAGFLKKMR